MGADTSTTVDAKEPVALAAVGKTTLAGNPSGAPKYGVTVKNLDGADITVGDPQISRALVALMNLHAVNGGAACHWGGPSAFAEIMSAIHGIMFSQGDPWHESFNFVNDAGHTENGIYALRANLGFDNMTFEDLKGFRSVSSKLTGHGESHLNPEGVLLSNGPLGSGLPQAQGLALGDKALGNDRVTICTISDGASMEGEAKEAFSAIPGLASKGKLNPFVSVISDNNTKLSGRIDDDSFSMAPFFASLAPQGWSVHTVEKGHDLQAVYTAIEKAVAEAKKNPNAPVAVIVKTIKGYGVSATEKSASGGHGYPLKKNDAKIVSFVDEIFGGNAPGEFGEWAQSLLTTSNGSASSSAAPAVPSTKVQAGISKGAIKAVEEGYPVYSVSADLQGSTGIAPFQKTYPDRFTEVGVAESNMVSTGIGLSKVGLIPIVDTFAQFGVTKGNLPLTMASLSQAPVIGLFSHTGFQDAADGASHQATTYFAALSSIPQLQVICCSCSDEAESLMYQAIKYIGDERKKGGNPDSVIFFVGRENYPVYYQENASYDWGKAQVIREGSDVVLVASGPMLGKALEAADILAAKGKRAAVVNNSFVNRPDIDTIAPLVAAAGGKLVTAEDHQVVGGMGSLLAHKLSLGGQSLKLKSLGIPNHFGQSAYVADDLYKKHGLTGEGIAAAAESL